MSSSRSPRWFFRAPSAEAVEAFRVAAAGDAFSYVEVGETRENRPASAGYDLDHNRALLGHGERTFQLACDAIRAWRMFPAPWTRIAPASALVREGQVIAMQARALGFWWLNACRIVYVVDDAAPVRRFGFAYGTLPAHVEQGEERFSVQLLDNGEVWYDLRAFSRPRFWPVRLGKPIARWLQRRFVRDSKRAMQEAAKGREIL